MEGSFACPECGTEIEPGERTPGRQVRCAECNTLVEVPFFPRGMATRRRRGRRSWWRAYVPVALAGAVGVCVLVGMVAFGSSRQAEHVREIARLIAIADDAARAGRWGEAFTGLESALVLSRTRRIEPPGGVEALAARRDDAARRDVDQRLEALRTMSETDAAVALGESLTVLARTRSAPGMANLTDRAEETAREARDRWLKVQAAVSRRLLDAGRGVEAVKGLERARQTAAAMPADLSGEAIEQLEEAVRQVVARVGVEVAPVQVATSRSVEPEPSHQAELRPMIVESLQREGYLAAPAGSPFATIWADAPFAFRLEVDERPGGRYMQSPNLMTSIEATLRLERAGRPMWVESVQARTREPIQNVSALEASRLGLGTSRNAEVEQRLYLDARADFRAKLARDLDALPACEGAASGPGG